MTGNRFVEGILHTVVTPTLGIIRPAALILSLSLLAGTAQAQICSIEKDKFTGERSIECEPFQVQFNQQPIHEIYSVSSGVTTDGGDTYYVLTIRASDFNFEEVEEADILIDGEHSVAPLETKNEVVDGQVIEQKTFAVGTKGVVKISRAESFQLRLGRTVFDMGPAIKQSKSLIQAAKRFNDRNP